MHHHFTGFNRSSGRRPDKALRMSLRTVVSSYCFTLRSAFPARGKTLVLRPYRLLRYQRTLPRREMHTGVIADCQSGEAIELNLMHAESE